MEQEKKQIVASLTEQLPTLRLVYLFGSRAKNEHLVDSDWDVAIACDKKLSPVTRWEIAQNLAIILDADVDLVDLLDASTVLKMQIVEQGDVLFSESNSAEYFEMQTYSMYGRLQEGRGDIVKNFIDNIKNA